MFKKTLTLFLSLNLIIVQSGFCQGVTELNLGQYLGQMHSNLAIDKFRPLHLRYLSYDPTTDNFQLLLDKGDNQDIKEAELQDKTKVLMEYFQIGLALPNDKFWVNLRPDAQDQIIDPELEKTDLGKVMLEADLQLKKDTAQWTSPQTPEGRLYWDKLYQKARELFGSEPANIPTITRPWIVPGEIIVREGESSAYIFKANLKVMLEEDYIKSQVTSHRSQVNLQDYSFKDPRMKELNTYSTQLIRELIIPKLTKEVNTAKRYAGLRQVFFSLVLARWFKERFSQSQVTGHRSQENALVNLIDSRNLTNLTSKQAWSKTTYFDEYRKSFEKGEYNLKEQVNTPTGQVIRSYVSGGLWFNVIKQQGYYNKQVTGASPLNLDRLHRLLSRLFWIGGAIYLTAVITSHTFHTLNWLGTTPMIKPKDEKVVSLPLTPEEKVQLVAKAFTDANITFNTIKEFLRKKGKPYYAPGLSLFRRKPAYLINLRNLSISIEEISSLPHEKPFQDVLSVRISTIDIVHTVNFYEEGSIDLPSDRRSERSYLEKKTPEELIEAVVKPIIEVIKGEGAGSLPLTPEGEKKIKESEKGGGEGIAGSPINKFGGIDFTLFKTLYQPMGGFQGLKCTLPTLSSSALERIDLDKELASLRKMASSGIAPSGQRLKEYLAACFQKGRMAEKQDDILVCLAEIYRLAEEEVLETSPELNESLVIADTGRFVLLPNNQKAGLN